VSPVKHVDFLEVIRKMVQEKKIKQANFELVVFEKTMVVLNKKG
jgi:hypothetical protein